jgi:hypothetical protein
MGFPRLVNWKGVPATADRAQKARGVYGGWKTATTTYRSSEIVGSSTLRDGYIGLQHFTKSS